MQVVILGAGIGLMHALDTPEPMTSGTESATGPMRLLGNPDSLGCESLM
ncbi:MAG: hypothetical protein ACKVIW_02000 [bacterium]